MWMTVGNQQFALTLDENPTARALVQLLPLMLEMSELNGNEKHGRLPRSLPTHAIRPGTIRTGDVLLYGNDTLVVFYETFQSSYSYTPIGRVKETAGLRQRLDRVTRACLSACPDATPATSMAKRSGSAPCCIADGESLHFIRNAFTTNANAGDG